MFVLTLLDTECPANTMTVAPSSGHVLKIQQNVITMNAIIKVIKDYFPC